jgi:hypothetical protein
MMNRARYRAALVLFAGCAAVITASAGNLSFLANSPLSYFTPEDMNLMQENSMRVLDAPGANPKQSWSNATTGASGWAQVRGQFTSSDGVPCKRLRIVNKAKGLQSDATYSVCKYPDRGWAFNADATPAK